MAKSKILTSLHFISLILLFSSLQIQNISPTSLGLKKEKLSHLHFYFHDIVSGPKPTAIRIAEAQTTNKSATLFGLIAMADDPLTVGPEPNSKLVGRAQGIYGSASQHEDGLLMVMNFAFVDGKYNGSTLSVLGRNMVLSTTREMPVVGGSGAFRFARGYALARTHWYNVETGGYGLSNLRAGKGSYL